MADTLVEMSTEFDILWNNIMSNAAPGLNEYEKSVFLTKAQDEIIKNYFNPNGNKYKEGFDGNQKRQVDFSMLLRIAKPTITSNASESALFDTRSKIVNFPEEVMFVVNEMVMATNDTVSTSASESASKPKYVALTVVPISFSEYTRLMAKPYKYPPKSICWRLLTIKEAASKNPDGDEGTTTSTDTTSTGTRIAELITSYKNLKDYVIRYVKQPDPIILVDLNDNYSDVSIGGKNKKTEYSLDPILIHEIVQRAVELAKAAYVGDAQSVITMGERSE